MLFLADITSRACPKQFCLAILLVSLLSSFVICFQSYTLISVWVGLLNCICFFWVGLDVLFCSTHACSCERCVSISYKRQQLVLSTNWGNLTTTLLIKLLIPMEIDCRPRSMIDPPPRPMECRSGIRKLVYTPPI